MIGKRMLYYRKIRGMTRKEVTQNTCNESTLYRIEKGKHIPRIDVFLELCKNLEIDPKRILDTNEDKFYPF